MSPVYWDRSFNAGHAEVDLQHRKFMTFINEMESLLLAPGSYDRHVRLDFLERLLEFTEKHFRLEKELMQESGCLDTSLCDHWRRYKNFDAGIYGSYREILAGKMVLDSSILKAIRDGFFNHVVGQDATSFRDMVAGIAGQLPMEVISENVLPA